MVILAVDSTARPFECDIGEKPNILAGYREFNPRAPWGAGARRCKARQYSVGGRAIGSAARVARLPGTESGPVKPGQAK
jgi:hypothetical protein